MKRKAVALAALLLAPGVAQAQVAQAQLPQPGAPDSFQSGGLRPPQAAPDDRTYEDELREGEAEDSGRGLEWLWIKAEVGGTYVGLQTFSANNLVDAGTVKTTEGGMLTGAAAGVRVVFVSLGGQVRMAALDQFNLWSFDGILGFHIPIGNIESHFTFGGGYSMTGDFSPTDLTNLDGLGMILDITGFNAQVAYGMDFYLNNYVSLGFDVTGTMMFLDRKGKEPPAIVAQAAPQATQVYERDGDSVGGGVVGTLALGFHL